MRCFKTANDFIIFGLLVIAGVALKSNVVTSSERSPSCDFEKDLCTWLCVLNNCFRMSNDGNHVPKSPALGSKHIMVLSNNVGIPITRVQLPHPEDIHNITFWHYVPAHATLALYFAPPEMKDFLEGVRHLYSFTNVNNNPRWIQATVKIPKLDFPEEGFFLELDVSITPGEDASVGIWKTAIDDFALNQKEPADKIIPNNSSNAVTSQFSFSIVILLSIASLLLT